MPQQLFSQCILFQFLKKRKEKMGLRRLRIPFDLDITCLCLCRPKHASIVFIAQYMRTFKPSNTKENKINRNNLTTKSPCLLRNAFMPTKCMSSALGSFCLYNQLKCVQLPRVAVKEASSVRCPLFQSKV